MIKYNNTPTIVVEDNVLSPALCERIISLAENKGLGDNLINRDGTISKYKINSAYTIFLRIYITIEMNTIINYVKCLWF